MKKKDVLSLLEEETRAVEKTVFGETVVMFMIYAGTIILVALGLLRLFFAELTLALDILAVFVALAIVYAVSHFLVLTVKAFAKGLKEIRIRDLVLTREKREPRKNVENRFHASRLIDLFLSYLHDPAICIDGDTYIDVFGACRPMSYGTIWYRLAEVSSECKDISILDKETERRILVDLSDNDYIRIEITECQDGEIYSADVARDTDYLALLSRFFEKDDTLLFQESDDPHLIDSARTTIASF